MYFEKSKVHVDSKVCNEAYNNAEVLFVSDASTDTKSFLYNLDELSFKSILFEHNALNLIEKLLESNCDIIFLTITTENYRLVGELIQTFRQMVSQTVSQTVSQILPNKSVPIVGLIASKDIQLMQHLKTCGITDFLSLDANYLEIALRVDTLLENRRLSNKVDGQHENRLAFQNDALIKANADLALLNQKIDGAYTDIFERLAKIAEYRDDVTGQHTERVGVLSARIAIRLRLSHDFIENIYKAACLHDLGKIAIPDSILLKPGRLTKGECKVMQKHCEIGAKLLSGSDLPLLKMAQRIALSHHEKLDGSGYPHQLLGEDIPLEARIVAVADTYDALCHKRPYKGAWREEDVISLLLSKKGSLFDSHVIDAFLDISRNPINTPKVTTFPFSENYHSLGDR